MDVSLDTKIDEHKAKTKIFKLVVLGLIYSFWTQSNFREIFNLYSCRPRSNAEFKITILYTYIILYFTTSVGLIWGVYIPELRYFKLWKFVKHFEIGINIINFCLAVTKNFHMLLQAISIIVLYIHLMKSVEKIYGSLSAGSEENNEQKDPSNYSSYDFRTDLPHVHEKCDINK